MNFFDLWVIELWGSGLVSLFATAVIYTGIGLFCRVGFMTLTMLLGLYFIIFGLGFYGMIFWFPLFLFSLFFLFLQVYKFAQGRTD